MTAFTILLIDLNGLEVSIFALSLILANNSMQKRPSKIKTKLIPTTLRISDFFTNLKDGVNERSNNGPLSKYDECSH